MLELKKVGENIKNARKSQDILQSTLAEKIGITSTTMSRIENGTVDIKLGTIYKIAAEFNLPVSNLIFGNNYLLISKEEIVKLSEKL